MKDFESIKIKWQQHNRDNGLSWNEVSQLCDEIAGVVASDIKMKLLSAYSENEALIERVKELEQSRQSAEFIEEFKKANCYQQRVQTGETFYKDSIRFKRTPTEVIEWLEQYAKSGNETPPKEGMSAEEWLVCNWRSQFNPLLDKANRSMPQYSFDDVTDMMEQYAQHINKTQ